MHYNKSYPELVLPTRSHVVVGDGRWGMVVELDLGWDEVQAARLIG